MGQQNKESDISIGDIVNLNRELDNIYIDWGGETPKDIKVIDIKNYKGITVAIIDKEYTRSDNEKSNEISIDFLVKDVVETRNNFIDNLLDEEE